ncbi:MAG TPA: hypothetical protein PKL56_16800 [Cyclobacteriaceae bacterium]|nr:hypothetical protein [Cyclobacteriaceae bacterium]HMV09286.1 hypothetical protein [Cyclobacteriaceae bacterium]HMX01914.1 hypothetical protein [Cyclobacteriaceae bacterium]HMX50837.1 hypothetical protein [Cyclobacteriaceae bacterium]HMY94737.1 hypothetical protein [Cyclobacteriaceae bacterium]
MKRNRYDALQILLVVLAVPLILYGLYLFFNWLFDQASHGVETVASRMRQVREKIEARIHQLNTEQATKRRLDTKSRRLVFAGKLIFLTAATAIYIVFLLNGFSAMESLSHAFFVITLAGTLLTLLFKSRVFTFNFIMRQLEEYITSWVYRRNKFNPMRIAQLQNEISNLQRQEKQLEDEMNGTGK